MESFISGWFYNHVLKPEEKEKLLEKKLGIVNLVDRPTQNVAELTKEEILQGKEELIKKVAQYQPEYLAVLGIESYKAAFNQLQAKVGLQKLQLGKTKIWLLPNPGGLNAHYKLPRTKSPWFSC